MKIKVNRTDSKEVYENELCDSYEKDNGISYKSCESTALASNREVIMDELRKTLMKILLSPSVNQEAKDFILNDETDLFPIIKLDWERYQRINKSKESPLKIAGGKIYLSEFE